LLDAAALASVRFLRMRNNCPGAIARGAMAEARMREQDQTAPIRKGCPERGLGCHGLAAHADQIDSRARRALVNRENASHT
jgi:hypothetical protein